MARTAIITGASGGIGAEVARVFAADGYQVILHYSAGRDAALRLEEELSGCRATALHADLRSRSEVEELVRAAQARFGPIDVLVNNAGIAQQKLFTDLTDEDWNQMFDINVRGMFYTCQGVLPGMIRRQLGRIVNISSIWGVTGASCEVHYSAAKAAVIGLTRALAKEVGPSGITVNCVAPGVIDTAMNAALSDDTRAALREETPLGMLGTPDDVAQAVLYLCSDKARFITGQVLGVNGGFVI